MIASLQCVVLDCPDVTELAVFYRSLLGGVVNQADRRWSVGAHFATLHMPGGLVLAFQRVEGFREPRWPDPAYPQQVHLDLDVPDLDDAQSQITALGARLLHVDARGWRVFADPAGHPICLIASPSITGIDSLNGPAHTRQ
jgi:glyoxalase superfamily protein